MINFKPHTRWPQQPRWARSTGGSEGSGKEGTEAPRRPRHAAPARHCRHLAAAAGPGPAVTDSHTAPQRCDHRAERLRCTSITRVKREKASYFLRSHLYLWRIGGSSLSSKAVYRQRRHHSTQRAVQEGSSQISSRRASRAEPCSPCLPPATRSGTERGAHGHALQSPQHSGSSASSTMLATMQTLVAI